MDGTSFAFGRDKELGKSGKPISSLIAESLLLPSPGRGRDALYLY